MFPGAIFYVLSSNVFENSLRYLKTIFDRQA